jgi:hypothetical protein
VANKIKVIIIIIIIRKRAFIEELKLYQPVKKCRPKSRDNVK